MIRNKSLKFIFILALASLFVGCASGPNARERLGRIAVPVDLKLDLNLCNTRVSNPPDMIARRVLRQSAFACANSVYLLVAPAPEACMTSGYGPRWGRRHQGVDYQSSPAGDVVAAGTGIIRELGFRRKDFGNWIVIDHGASIFTAYGHLASFSKSLYVGRKVLRGEKLGVMGKTGNGTNAVHLHYEIRRGKLESGGNFFGLTSVNPFDLPEECD